MKNKKKVLIPVISTLAVGLLVGVGFATWTIAGHSVTKSVDGNTINAETIVDKRVTLTTSTTAQTISFSSKEATTTNSWLSRDGKSTEKLVFSFAFTLKANDTSTMLNSLVSSVEYTITVNDNTSKGWAAAVTAGYVSSDISFANPASSTTAIGTAASYTSISSTAATQDITIAGSFGWGLHFGNKNPYEYYNAQAVSDTLANDAKNSLSALNKDLEGVTFTLTVKTVVAA